MAGAQARGKLALATEQLDLPADLGVFPYVQVATTEATDHEIVTVLTAQQASEEDSLDITIQPEAAGWRLKIGTLAVRIDASGEVPDVTWS